MTAGKPPRKEIWLRKIYIPFVEDKSITTIFRPGRRLLAEQHPKALGVGEEVRVRIINKIGADWAEVYGELMSEPNIPVVITTVTVKLIENIEANDFSGSTPDVMNLDALKMQLALIYNLSRDELSSGFWVTRTTFRYLAVE